MILRICFVFLFIFTSVSVHAQGLSDPYARACKKLVKLVNDKKATTPDLVNLADEIFILGENGVRDTTIIDGAMKFIFAIQKVPVGTQDDQCQKDIRRKFKQAELKKIDVSQTVSNQYSPELAGAIPVTVISNKSMTLPNQSSSKVKCTQEQESALCADGEIRASNATEPLEVLNRKMLGSLLTNSFSEKDCDCFSEKLNENKIMQEASQELGRVDKSIVKAVGKKFLNDFAALHEDLIYYANTKAPALQKNYHLKLDKKSLCTDSDTFEASIDAACKLNKTMAGKEERMAELFGAYGYNLKSGKEGLKKGFDDLVDDIEAPSSSYSREKFDDYRFGLGYQPEVILLDELTANILQDQNLKSDLKKYMDKGSSPLEAVELILSGSTERKKLLNLFQKIKNPGCQDLISKLSATNGPAFDQERGRIFDVGLNMHPGLKMLLKDRKLLEKASLSLDGNSHGIIENAEKNLLFAGHFAERCQSLQKKFAEAVCTDSSDLRDMVNKQDLIHLLNADETDNSTAINLLICSTNNNKVPAGSAFDELVIDDRRNFTVSDYYSKQEKKPSFFSNSANLSNDPALNQRMNKISTAFEYERVSTGKSSITDVVVKPYFNEDEFMAGVKQKYTSSKADLGSIAAPKENISYSESPDSNSSATRNIINTQLRSIASNTDLVKGFTQPFQANTPQVVEELKAQDVASPRTELKKILSGGDQAKISNHLKNINDEDAQELVDLRRQVTKGKDELTALRLEQETKKTQELKDQYDALAKRFDILSKERFESSGQSNGRVTDMAQGFKNSSFGVPNDKNTVSESKGPTEAMGSFAQNGIGSQATAHRDVNKADNGLLIDSQNNGLNGQKLVITSKMQDGKKVSEDPSSDLINYLMKNDADTKTLKELKESGLIYTYDLDDNGKIIQVSKLIKYSQLSAEAKTLVDNKLQLLSKLDSKSFTELESDMLQAKRKYSYQVLKMEMLLAK